MHIPDKQYELVNYGDVNMPQTSYKYKMTFYFCENAILTSIGLPITRISMRNRKFQQAKQTVLLSALCCYQFKSWKVR